MGVACWAVVDLVVVPGLMLPCRVVCVVLNKATATELPKPSVSSLALCSVVQGLADRQWVRMAVLRFGLQGSRTCRCRLGRAQVTASAERRRAAAPADSVSLSTVKFIGLCKRSQSKLISRTWPIGPRSTGSRRPTTEDQSAVRCRKNLPVERLELVRLRSS